MAERPAHNWLVVGSSPTRPTPRISRTKMNSDKLDLHWLAGLLEAEGSFLQGPPSDPRIPRIKIQMTDEDIIARVAQIFGVQYHQTPLKAEQRKIPYIVFLRGTRAAQLMLQVYPLMSSRRQQQIDLALQGYNFTPRNKGEKHGNAKLNDEQVLEIKRQLLAGLPQRRIAEAFDVKPRTISDIRTGKSWSHLSLDTSGKY